MNRPSRKWRQFSLCTLLAGTAVVAAFLGWVVYERRKAARQEAAFTALESRGNGNTSVSYGVDPSPRPYALKVLLGDDIYGKMTDAMLNDPSISDCDLHYLGELPGLTNCLSRPRHYR